MLSALVILPRGLRRPIIPESEKFEALSSFVLDSNRMNGFEFRALTAMCISVLRLVLQ